MDIKSSALVMNSIMNIHNILMDLIHLHRCAEVRVHVALREGRAVAGAVPVY